MQYKSKLVVLQIFRFKIVNVVQKGEMKNFHKNQNKTKNDKSVK